MGGTKEPESATGEYGTGKVPRESGIIDRFAAAFNGGFQAIHGEFGMMADGQIYIEPKPYAATVARERDGSMGFGTWNNDIHTIPPDMVSYRQNLTPLIEDGKINPFKRRAWGGGNHQVVGAAPDVPVLRTGVCLTKEEYAIYFYAEVILAADFARIMQTAHCQYGIELDIHAAHVGMEFYRIFKTSQGLGEPAPKLQPMYSAMGKVPGRPDLSFLGRLMVRGAAGHDFPRYIGTDARDFLYLTLRLLLPGKPIAPLIQPVLLGEGEYAIDGLPQGPLPYPQLGHDIYSPRGKSPQLTG